MDVLSAVERMSQMCCHHMSVNHLNFDNNCRPETTGDLTNMASALASLTANYTDSEGEDEQEDGEEQRAWVCRWCYRDTVPVIFVGTAPDGTPASPHYPEG